MCDADEIFGEDEVTCWLESLQRGSDVAAEQIWRRYFDRLTRLARRRLNGSPRRDADEEDVALSALNSFCRAAKEGRWPQLTDRDDLWKLLITLTIRKANAQLRKEHRKKRGSGAVRGESVFDRPVNSENAAHGLGNQLGDEPTPEFAAMVTEQCDRLLAALDDESLIEIATCKLHGFTNEEIAEKLNCVPRTITRKLDLIRSIWKSELSNQQS